MERAVCPHCERETDHERGVWLHALLRNPILPQPDRSILRCLSCGHRRRWSHQFAVSFVAYVCPSA
jgi:hypothetical protein